MRTTAGQTANESSTSSNYESPGLNELECLEQAVSDPRKLDTSTSVVFDNCSRRYVPSPVHAYLLRATEDLNIDGGGTCTSEEEV